MIDTALAQSAAGGAPPALVSFLPLILVFGVFYFLLIRPQQKRAKQHRALVDNLKAGDAVVSAGGMHGKIISVQDGFATVEIATGVKVKMNRASIVEVASVA